MFVPINSADMDAFKVEEWINRTRDDNGGVISPEFAMDVLGKTNHFAHIKKLINLIKKSCSDKNGELVADKVLAYKEFILSAIDGREHEGMALKGLQEFLYYLYVPINVQDIINKTKQNPHVLLYRTCGNNQYFRNNLVFNLKYKLNNKYCLYDIILK